jgi:N-acetylmuramoyl-L-alanine amidase
VAGVEDEIIDTPSPNFDDRDQPVSMVVLHYTGMQDGASAIAKLCDPDAGVSSHYVVEEDGRILRLVPEDKRAWHAGKAHWRGNFGVNAASIGVEIVNPGHALGYRPYPAEQMASVVRLLADIRQRHAIPLANVVGHSDVAPTRKQDPGELFDWALLARHGLAVSRPTQGLVDPGWADSGFLIALERYGYDVRDAFAATVAFQRRFRPDLMDGTIDGECRAILLRLLLDREAEEAT